MKAKFIKQFINEGRYDNNNLDEPNSYYTVTKPFKIYIKSGDRPAGYYGASQVYEPIYKEVFARPGDEIQNLHGGKFFKGEASNNQRVHVRTTPKVKSPFERGLGEFQKFPLDKLIRVK